MQLTERNKEKILAIYSNTHAGYGIHLKDGRTFHCRTKPDVRKLFSQTLAKEKTVGRGTAKVGRGIPQNQD